LIPALIVIAILALVTVATMRLANISKGQSARDARALAQAACIDAARQYLISRTALLAPNVAVQFDQVIATESGDRHIYSGHVRPLGSDGKPSGNVTLSAVQAVASSAVGGSRSGKRDMSNVVGPVSLGARPYMVVVGCTDPMGNDMELEFSLKFGL
jgi:hypothetical protein